MDVKDYAKTLLAEAGMSDEAQVKAVEALFSNEKVSKKLLADFVPLPDHSRKVNELTTAAEAAENKAKGWYADEMKKWGEYEARGKRLKQYEDTYGVLDGGSVTTAAAAAATGLSKEDVEKMLQARDAQTVTLLKGVGEITADYVTRFGKKPDFNAIEKIAIDKRLSLDQAYQEYIQPEVQTRTSAEMEAKVKLAREEGLKEGLSRAHLPIDTAPKQPHPFFDRPKAESVKDGRGRVASFEEAWNKSQATQ